MNFEEVLEYLNDKKESKIVLGLDRVERFLKALGDPHERLRVIHVTGTNGKGSVCQMLASIFWEAGYPAGLYTSPHLHEINERVVIEGDAISNEDLSAAASELSAIRGHEELTYFEFLTCLAFYYFANAGADPVILETGLGGRLDATNVVTKPLATVITTIDYDHTRWLGSTLENIALEKAGIIKKGTPVIIGRVPAITVSVFEQRALQTQSDPLRWIKETPSQTNWNLGVQEFSWMNQKFQTPLLGNHQIHNACLALETLEVIQEKFGLNLSREKKFKGLRKTQIPGRWDLKFSDGKIWVFDVAHNPQAVSAHKKTLEASPWAEDCQKLLIAGFLNDKDFPVMLGQLAGSFKYIWLVEAQSERACKGEDLMKTLSLEDRLKTKIVPSISSAIELAKRDPRVGFVSVLGSFRVVAPALEAFNATSCITF